MKMMRFLIVLMCSCTLLAGCKPAAKDKPDNMLSLSVKIDGIPNTDSFFNARNGVGINAITDTDVANVYVKAFHSDTRIHIPDNAAGGVASLSRNTGAGTWDGVLSFPDPSGSVIFLAYAVDSSGRHLYSGTSVIFTNIQQATSPVQITVAGNTNPNASSGGYVLATPASATLGWGPGGGWVFYDKGYYADGWRYMEAAPNYWNITGTDPSNTWSTTYKLVFGSGGPVGIGTGKTNTATIVSAYGAEATAAKTCSTLNFNAYQDWFLPSDDELHEMFTTLHKASTPLGAFDGAAYYWTSSESINSTAWALLFYDLGGGVTPSKDTNKVLGEPDRNIRIRPARQF